MKPIRRPEVDYSRYNGPMNDRTPEYYHSKYKPHWRTYPGEYWSFHLFLIKYPIISRTSDLIRWREISFKIFICYPIIW